MKKLLAVLLALCVMLAAFSALAEGAPTIGGADSATQETYSGNPYAIAINDEGDLLTEKEKADVLEMMRVVSKYANVGFLTHPAGRSAKYSAGKAQSWGDKTFGPSEKYTVFIIDMTLRHLDIYASAPLAGVLTSEIENSIADNVYRYATRGEYGDCAVETFRLIANVLKGEEPEEEFVFRGKIRWGMSMEEVLALEGEPMHSETVGAFSTLSFASIPISKYTGTLGYAFSSDLLRLSIYALGEADAEAAEYLKIALSAVYGEETVADAPEVWAIASKLTERSVPEDEFADDRLYKWAAAGGTTIYLIAESSGNLEIVYVSPEFMDTVLESDTERINTTGL